MQHSQKRKKERKKEWVNLEKRQEPLGGPHGIGMMHVKGFARRFTCIATIFIFIGITVVILITSGVSLRPTCPRRWESTQWKSRSNWVYGLPWWLSGKESTCQCRRCGFDPWVGEVPWRRKWQPNPVFLPGKFHGQRNLAGHSPWSCKDSDMT